MFITPSFKKSLIVEQFQGNYLKVAQSRFQHLDFMVRYSHSLFLDATIMVSEICSIIGEHVVIIFVTQ